MRRHRRVPLTPKVPANRNEADVGGCTRVAVDLKVSVYIAKVGFAGTRIVGALEITCAYRLCHPNIVPVETAEPSD